jgi:hypothetical protein
MQVHIPGSILICRIVYTDGGQQDMKRTPTKKTDKEIYKTLLERKKFLATEIDAADTGYRKGQYNDDDVWEMVDELEKVEGRLSRMMTREQRRNK